MLSCSISPSLAELIGMEVLESAKVQPVLTKKNT
jgi:hypothetical protein